ncbi:MAG: L,D-transpeptidase family protein [bacterium]
MFVEGILVSLPSDVMDQAEAQTTGQEIKKRLEVESKRGWNARIAGGIKYADLFQTIYASRDYRKVFAQSSGLRPRGEVALKVLLEADKHALDPSPYHVSMIQTLATRLAELDDKSTPPDLTLTGNEAEALIQWLKNRNLSPSKPETYDQLVKAIVAAQGSPVPRVTERVRAYQAKFAKTAVDSAELELRTADGILRYARDMKHFNLNRQDWRDLKEAGGSKALIYSRLQETFDDLARATTSEQIASVLKRLEPPHPQYERLVAALARYRAIAADGGWKSVSQTTVEIGARSPRIGDLRRRLAVEGYLETPASSASANEINTADAALVDAFHAFQATHQFNADAGGNAAVWRSLNVSVSRRIEQIVTTLERWRESRYANEPDYVFVNIPDFHAEIYEKHTLAMRFRVVVGNTVRQCDAKTKKWVMPNATPIQMAEMDHLIINPFWNVPERIVEEELEPKFKSDPTWLEKNNYEIVTVKGGNTWIRQKPGDDNALGRVKFIFPNRHNTYMHDTPKKKYFDYPVRAFSHGCVRVHEPIEFAEYLLNKDGLATKEEVEALLAEGTQKKFTLKTKLPVFFEYYVVRVDDQGRTHFLADVYKLDQLRGMPDDPDANSCAKKLSHSQDSDGDTTAPSDVSGDLGP